MSFTYIPTEWHTGDIITENKLNNIENGIRNLYPANAEIIAPPQVLTITAETTEPVSIALAEGKSINPDLWAAGGYYITVEKIDEPTMDKVVLPLITEVDHTMSRIMYGYEYPLDDPNYNQWYFNVIYDLLTYTCTLVVATLEDDEWIFVPGSYRISIVIPGVLNSHNCIYPKLLIHNDNGFYWNNVVDAGESETYLVDPDVIALNYCPDLVVVNGMFSPFGADGVQPAMISAVAGDGGFYLAEPCIGLRCMNNNVEAYILPNTATVAYASGL